MARLLTVALVLTALHASSPTLVVAQVATPCVRLDAADAVRQQ